ncbi:MAG: hypothetical protein DRI52_12725 [Chloroflexi bacterium]|nr:MAG: hypothetical protein DRI52_12725 [Chloroflexota bacterium]
MIKLLMGWDIKPGREAEYHEFIVGEFMPRLMKLGIRLTDAWYTIYGQGPQILAGGVAEDLETMAEALESREWRNLREKLLTYVTNFQQKVVPATGHFQLL